MTNHVNITILSLEGIRIFYFCFLTDFVEVPLSLFMPNGPGLLVSVTRMRLKEVKVASKIV